MPGLIQHSSATNEHYTPLDYIEAARKTLGYIDLDPATTHEVNRDRVKANAFYTKETNGLDKPWWGRVWLNPPGGRIGSKSSAAVWWAKLAEEWSEGRTAEAVFLGFTLEILATSQDSRIWVGSLPFCIPRHRIAFDNENGTGTSPAHSNIVVYLPAREGKVDRFVDAFSKFGLCNSGGML